MPRGVGPVIATSSPAGAGINGAGRLPRRCLSCDARGVTEAEAREVIRSRVREVFAREPVRGFLLGLQVGAAVVWVARAEVEGDTFARRAAVILQRWGLAA